MVASSVTGATTASDCVVGEPGDQPTEALEHQGEQGGDERAPRETGHQQRARLRLVAVQPEVAADQRPDRDQREDRGDDDGRAPSGEGDHERDGDGSNGRDGRDHGRAAP